MRSKNAIDQLARIIDDRPMYPPKMTGTSGAVGTDLETRQNRLPLPIGSLGDVLTVVDDAGDDVPAWQPPAAATVTALDDVGDVNAPTPANGDVLTWDSTPGEWVALPAASSITELDDIPDVNAPTPGNGDVLTWDSTPGEWVASPPGTSITELDDIPDVNAPTPSNGDVLTWDSTPGEWVNLPPSAAGGDVSSDTATSVDNELVLFKSTTGKLIKRATFTGVLRADSGVVSVDSDVTDIVAAATASAAGKVELATTAETETGTDATRAVTPDGLHDMTTLAGAAWFLDEDTMSSDSAVKTASQQSIKAYVDAAVGVGSGTVFGLEWLIDEGGVPGLNVKAYRSVPFACVITGYTLLADQAGDIVLDVWHDTYANYPPTVADTITASAKPTLSAATKSQNLNVSGSGWTNLTLAAHDILAVKVDSAASLQLVTFTLICERT